MEKKHKRHEVHHKPCIIAYITNAGLSGLNDEFLEVTAWTNGGGVDIYFSKGCVDKLPIRISLSFEEADKLRVILNKKKFNVIKKMEEK